MILILIAASAASLKTSPPLSQRQPRELQSETRNNSNVNSRNTKTITDVLLTLDANNINSNPEYSSSNAGSKKNTDLNDGGKKDPMITYTFWLMIFTGVLAISTIGLWIVTIRDGKHTEKAANAAKDSADALPIIERAYVFVEEIMWQNLFVDEPIQPVTNYLSVRFINHGNTPAIIRKVFVLPDKVIVYPTSVDIGDFKIPEGIVVSSREDKKSGVISIITSAEEIKKIREGTLKLICYGCIIYEDILRKERRTYFCWEYNESIGGFYISGNKELNYYT